jgi:hypothetical protein
MLTLPLGAAEAPIQISLVLAGVSLASSIVLAVVSSRNAERLARLASKLDEHKAEYAAQLAQRDAETNARRTYEYETRSGYIPNASRWSFSFRSMPRTQAGVS